MTAGQRTSTRAKWSPPAASTSLQNGRPRSRSPTDAPWRADQHRPTGAAGSMSPSRPFILRPVATSLLMAAILLVGIVAYTQLPVSALPEVDYPTIQVLTFYPGASPDVDRLRRHRAAGAPVRPGPGLSQMTSTSSGGISVIVMQFQLSAQHRRRRAGGAGRHQRRAELPARQPARPADLQQDQPGRRARPHPRAHLEHHAAVAGRRPRRHPPRAQDLAAHRRRPGQHQRRPEARRPHPGQPHRARPPTASTWKTCAPPSSSTSVNAAKGNFDGPRQDYQIDANDQLVTSDDYKRRRRRLPQRRARHAHRRRQGRRRRREQQAGRLDEPDAGRHPQHPAPARRQHHRGRRQHQEAAAAARGQPSRRPSRSRSLTDRTTTIRASVEDVEFELLLTIGLVVMVIFLFLRSLSATIIPSVAVPLSLVGTFGVMYLARLQPQQPHADGAHHLHRLRRRRRHRHDREHLALHRRGRDAAWRPRSRAPSRSASPSSRSPSRSSPCSSRCSSWATSSAGSSASSPSPSPSPSSSPPSSR